MVEENNNSQKRKLLISGAIVLMVAAIVLLAIATLRPHLQKCRITGCRGCSVPCGSNLSGLTKAIAIYVAGSGGSYPTPDKWCDLLLQHTDVAHKEFQCYGNRKEKCSYAINPNVSPMSMSRIPAIRLGKYITEVGATSEMRINLSEASILILESLSEFNINPCRTLKQLYYI